MPSSQHPDKTLPPSWPAPTPRCTPPRPRRTPSPVSLPECRLPSRRRPRAGLSALSEISLRVSRMPWRKHLRTPQSRAVYAELGQRCSRCCIDLQHRVQLGHLEHAAHNSAGYQTDFHAPSGRGFIGFDEGRGGSTCKERHGDHIEDQELVGTGRGQRNTFRQDRSQGRCGRSNSSPSRLQIRTRSMVASGSRSSPASSGRTVAIRYPLPMAMITGGNVGVAIKESRSRSSSVACASKAVAKVIPPGGPVNQPVSLLV